MDVEKDRLAYDTQHAAGHGGLPDRNPTNGPVFLRTIADRAESGSPNYGRTIRADQIREGTDANMQSDKGIRVLIVDDHPLVRRGLALMLKYEADMEVVAQAANGREALQLFREQRPDVTLMDLRMPDMGGVDTITAVRSEFPHARIIVLTTYDGEEDIYRGLRAGAQAYLLKDTPCDELLDTIRHVYAGHKRISREVGAKLAERTGFSELTERELDVLRLMVRGMSNQEIGADLSIAEGTVKFHVNHILNKMGVNDRTQAVIAALRRGLASLD